MAAVETKLPEFVKRARRATRFAWEEFFVAERHNLHTQRAYESAVRRFLSWCERESVELVGISPGTVGQYLTAPARQRSVIDTSPRCGVSSAAWCNGDLRARVGLPQIRGIKATERAYKPADVTGSFFEKRD